MAKASNAYPNQLVLIDGYPIDCTLTENHSFDSEVTQYPVESGSVITDNVRLQPLTIDLDCIISNTPFGEARSDDTSSGVAFISNDVRTTTVYQNLISIRDDREPIPLRTSRGLFKNMILKSISIPRDDKTGDAMRLTLHFIQVTIIENQRGKRVAIPIAAGGGNKTKPTATPDKSTPDNNRSYEGTRMMTTIDGVQKVWSDPDIGLWRHSWFTSANPTVEGDSSAGNGQVTNKLGFVFVKGPLLDGFVGSDAECIAHADKLFQQFGKSKAGTDAYTKLLLRGHNPYKTYPATSSPTYNNATMGRVVNVDGSPGMPSQPRFGDLHSKTGPLLSP